ncbi:hypothetical protein MM300_07285 [Evansella sp. LMS18]|uniref:hypothetical protein n=1 Tax=Evansella sp. LMS18 TaxID=2924033 RepID=UPI0020D0F7D6|nr:hypothetical protein [Evansella sp. LMS18]UTR12087.1 hypothetical protein MM300_07285 [Evansella sp. LMS18]
MINNLNVFTESLSRNEITVRYGLVTYSDIHEVEMDPPVVKYPFTENVDEFREQLQNINLTANVYRQDVNPKQNMYRE